MRFAGRLALVTGAARGIGLEIARCLMAEGAEVIAADRDPGALAESFGSLRGVRTAVVDVTRRDTIERALAEHVGDRPLHLLVNNAGIVRDAWLEKMTDEDFDTVLGVNLRGAFLVTRAAAPALKRPVGAAVVNLSSRAALGNPGQAAYSASKAGLLGMTRALARELARFKVRVNAVAPGLIDTPLSRGLRPDVLQRLIDAQPTKEMGSVRDVANAVLFLGSDDARFITGQVLFVDGGKSVGLVGP